MAQSFRFRLIAYIRVSFSCLLSSPQNLDITAVKFNRYIIELAKFVFSSSLILGLVLGMVVLVTGGAEGSITIDIDLSASDSIWFLLATPLLITAVFILLSPLSYCLHFLAFKQNSEDRQQ